ncbi:hypothetical protein PROFUN_03272 [Planoprotostelium fungivorum]|uniref:DUF7906 domain-containing protein n=1 Tax=Planoprotostelium fungivorum TaxID=1890364 RepID=A0A2P6NWU6_9EUKA|nr:hypothetical protein PROFUN_03272 [Planoprotostelium fungivorum]
MKTSLFFLLSITVAFCLFTKDDLRAAILTENRETDPFLSLSSSDLAKDWSHEGEEDLVARVDHLIHSFEEGIYVEVCLVGFPSRSTEKNATIIDRNQLSKLLADITLDDTVTALYPRNHDRHEIFVKRKFLFQVVETDDKLDRKLGTIIQGHLSQNQKVPIQAIDDVIREDYNRSPDRSVRVYLINPRLPTDNYSYTYGPTSCSTPLSLGSRDDRFLWIDTRAAVSHWGMKDIGEGNINPGSLPSTRQTYLKSHTVNELMVSMVRFLRRTCEYLLAPSISHYPLPEQRNIYLHLIIMSDHALGGGKFDWNFIQKQVKSLNIPGHEIHFKETVHSFNDCVECDIVYRHALKMQRIKERTLYQLDSKDLQKWLKHFRSSLWGETITIPIFLFDLSAHDVLPIDGLHQSVAYEGMIVAFQSQAPSANTQYSCDRDDVKIDTRDATKNVLSSILDTLLGISPSHKRWSTLHEREVNDYMWSVSSSPGSIFSQSTQLAFTVADNSARHVIYTQLDVTLRELNYVLRHFESHGRHLYETLTLSEQIQFSHRWYVLQFKIEEAGKHLSHFEFESANKYVTSMKHDVTALHDMVHVAGDRLQLVFSCRKESEESVLVALDTYTRTVILVSPFVFALWVALRRCRPTENKTKR